MTRRESLSAIEKLGNQQREKNGGKIRSVRVVSPAPEAEGWTYRAISFGSRGKAGRLTYVGKPSRLAPGGASAPEVRRDALLD
jgi:hypothetical protein